VLTAAVYQNFNFGYEFFIFISFGFVVFFLNFIIICQNTDWASVDKVIDSHWS